MPITYKDFVERWNSLERMPNGYVLLDPDHPLALEIGYLKSMDKSFIVYNTDAVPSVSSTVAVKVDNIKLNNGKWALGFRLTNLKFEEEFLRLCWDMMDASRDASSPLNALMDKYLSWQKFLQQKPNQAMSFEKQKGLTGELLFFKENLDKFGGDKLIEAWKGPEGASQDYRFDDSWAEIKVVALSANTVKISSMEQLAQDVIGDLVVYTLEPGPESDESVSLNKIVDQIKVLLNSPVLTDRFDIKLYKYGYRNEERQEYDKNRFRYVKKSVYSVDSDFPKITGANTAPAIASCSYDLSLAGIEHFKRG